MRFFIGLLVGLFLLGGYAGYHWYQGSQDPCLERCGQRTECQEGLCVASADDDDDQVKRKKKKRRRWRRRRRPRAANAATTATTAAEETLRTVSAADLKSASKGPSLRQTDYIKMGTADGTTRELSTAEINAKVRRLDRAIVACIDRARGEYDVQQGKVSVAFRIERSGRVAKVRVTAPRVLQRGGLFGCVAPKIQSLRFGPSTLEKLSWDRGIPEDGGVFFEHTKPFYGAGIHCYYYDKGEVQAEHLVQNLVGAALKDTPEDLKKLRHYFDHVVKRRKGAAWKEYYQARKHLL